jgi:acyl-CoA reductase-like NAD-dependent aldehyde dehydrogenase
MATVLPDTPAGPATVADPAEVVPDAVSRARGAQAVWERVDVRDRARALLRLHDVLHDRREEVAATVRAATGKSRRDAAAEVVACLTVTRYYGLRAPSLLRPYRRRLTGVAVPVLTEGLVRRVPAGVVGNIAAWNFPLVFLLGDTAPALVAGNAVVLKPDPRSDGVAAAVESLVAATGMPAGLVTTVSGGRA